MFPCLKWARKIPTPHSILEYRVNPDFSDVLWTVMDVDVRRFEGKSEKINITLPKRLLVQINNCAKASLSAAF